MHSYPRVDRARHQVQRHRDERPSRPWSQLAMPPVVALAAALNAGLRFEHAMEAMRAAVLSPPQDAMRNLQHAIARTARTRPMDFALKA